jgi:hypothetical protein
MTTDLLIAELGHNKGVFSGMLREVPQEMVNWRKEEGAWCLLEIVCHLLDEEREDFRARIRLSLEHPGMPLPPIDPVGWVNSRAYMQQEYREVLGKFLQEREASVCWLMSLKGASWKNNSIHPEYGEISAGKFLCNWLAHDYHHIRQVNRLKYHYLRTLSETDLSYAGNW